MVERVARLTVISCVAIAALYAAWKRSIVPGFAVLGGGLLMGISFWAIRSSVDEFVLRHNLSHPGGAAGRHGAEGAKAEKAAGLTLVKFFTRHAIVALAAYGMMVRLHLDPVGLLAGVSSLGVAAAVEALRDLRWRRFL